MMKAKTFATFLCIMGFCIRSEAQMIRSAGIKVGASIAGQDWHYSSTSQPFADQYRWGYTFGVFIEWLDISTFSLSTEIQYSQKGFKQEFERRADDGTVLGTYYLIPQIDYLSIPILLKMRYELT